MDEEFLRVRRIDNVVAREPAHKAVGQLDHFVLAFIDGGDPDAVGGAAVVLLDDDVLGHVHQLAGHVTGVGGLEGGVGQTLARAVRGDEIFQHRKALAEIRQNRFFDDVAAGLGHETAQAGELAHLLFVAARAGIHHQVDRVVFLLALGRLEGAEHDAGNHIGAMCPDVHDLVVTFARGDDTFAILLFDFFDLLLGGVNLFVAFLGHDHVVDADGRAGLGGFTEAEFLELVEHGDGFFVAGKLVTFPDQVAELALAGGFVVKAEFRRPDFTEDDPAHGGLDELFIRVAIDSGPAKIRIRQANTSWVFNAPSS